MCCDYTVPPKTAKVIAKLMKGEMGNNDALSTGLRRGFNFASTF